MSISLTQLLSEVALAVQQTNTNIDLYTSDLYINQGYDIVDADNINNADNTFKPKTYKIILPNSNEEINVPKSILMNHKSIQLDEIDFKIKVALSENEINPNSNDLLVDIKSENENTNFISEINLHFKSAPTPEGTARIQSKYLQDL